MERIQVLKAIADETRFNLIELLLTHNYCVRALARKLSLSEATISQHLKVLREAGLIEGEKRGYFMHYTVNCELLREIAAEIVRLSEEKQILCTPERGGCQKEEHMRCHVAQEQGKKCGCPHKKI